MTHDALVDLLRKAYAAGVERAEWLWDPQMQHNVEDADAPPEFDDFLDAHRNLLP